jgi:hypothetical protein
MSNMTPDTSKMLFYPHDGELEGGGVYVDPSDDGHVYLLVRGRYIEVVLYDLVEGHFLSYPHDGELEDGGVYVNQRDKSYIDLLVKGCYTRVVVGADPR